MGLKAPDLTFNGPRFEHRISVSDRALNEYLTKKLGEGFPGEYYLKKVLKSRIPSYIANSNDTDAFFEQIYRRVIGEIFIEGFKPQWAPIAQGLLKDDKISPDDALQDTYATILFGGLPKNEPVKSIDSWLYVVLKNRCLSLIRKKARKRVFEFDSDWDTLKTLSSQQTPSFEESYPIKEEINFYISQMPTGKESERKKVLSLQLFYLQGYQHKDIAEAFGISESHSRNILQDALEDLRSIYRKINGHDFDPDDGPPIRGHEDNRARNTPKNKTDHNIHFSSGVAPKLYSQKCTGNQTCQKNETMRSIVLSKAEQKNTLYDYGYQDLDLDLDRSYIFILGHTTNNDLRSYLSSPRPIANKRHFINSQVPKFENRLLLLYSIRQFREDYMHVIRRIFEVYCRNTPQWDLKNHLFCEFFIKNKSLLSIGIKPEKLLEVNYTLEDISKTILSKAVENYFVPKHKEKEIIAKFKNLIDIISNSYRRKDSLGNQVYKELFEKEKPLKKDFKGSENTREYYMNRHLTSEDLLKYLRKEYNAKEQRAIEALISQNSRYREMLDGLEIILSDQQKDMSLLEEVLEEKKSAFLDFVDNISSREEYQFKDTESVYKEELGFFDYSFSSLVSKSLRNFKGSLTKKTDNALYKYENHFNESLKKSEGFNDRSLPTAYCFESIDIFENSTRIIQHIEWFSYEYRNEIKVSDIFSWKPVSAKTLDVVTYILSHEEAMNFKELEIKIRVPFQERNPIPVEISSIEQCLSHPISHSRLAFEELLISSSINFKKNGKEVRVSNNKYSLVSFNKRTYKERSLSGYLPKENTSRLYKYDRFTSTVDNSNLHLELDLVHLLRTFCYIFTRSFLHNLFRDEVFSYATQYRKNDDGSIICKIMRTKDEKREKSINFRLLSNEFNTSDWEPVFSFKTTIDSLINTFESIILIFFDEIKTASAWEGHRPELTTAHYKYKSLNYGGDKIELEYSKTDSKHIN